MAKNLAPYLRLLHLVENVIQVHIIKFEEVTNGMSYTILLTLVGSPFIYKYIYLFIFN